MIGLSRRFPVQTDYFQVFSHPDCLLHDVGDDHPETSARLEAVLRGCGELPANMPISWQVPPPASAAELTTVHDMDYLEQLHQACSSGAKYFMSPDNHIGPNTYRAVLAAGGCVLALARTLLDQGAGFALVRPPGHHAGRRKAQGFCFINHTALTIEAIRRQQPDAAFLVVDFDVHHGHGFNFIYYADPGVFYYSLHGEPDKLYPNTGYWQETGQGSALGHTCNVSLPIGCSGDVWLQVFKQHIIRFKDKINPDYLLVNAGFDAHREDPFSVMRVEDHHYQEAVECLHTIALDHCCGRIGLLLEGGYAAPVLERLLPRVIQGLAMTHASKAGA